jgi:hypothetical protein
MITYNWMEKMEIPQPDFDVKLQCRDWDALKQWQDGHALSPSETAGTWRRQGGEKEVPAPWQWLRIAEEDQKKQKTEDMVRRRDEEQTRKS